MTGAIANLLVNIIIVVLLAVTIGYCWVLNRRIKVLQDSKGELAQLLKHFDESTRRASESIIALQTASKKIGENIQIRAEKAHYLLDDLAFMIEKADKVANKMEASFAVNRARSRVMADESVPHAELPPEPKPESELRIPVVDKPETSRERTAATLEAVLERVMGRNKTVSMADEADRDIKPRPKPRSRTEQELLDMLKTGLKG